MKTNAPAPASLTPQTDAVPQLIAATANTLPEQVNALARARAFAEPLMAGETLDGRLRMSGRCTWGGAELPSLDGRLAFLPQPSPMHADVQGELPLDATPGREAARVRRADHQFRAVMDVLSMVEIVRRRTGAPEFSRTFNQRTSAATEWLRHLVDQRDGVPAIGATPAEYLDVHGVLLCSSRWWRVAR